MCYRIAEWNQRYEVSKKGAPATDGDELRVGPLTYIRSAVHGRQMSLGFRKLQKYSGKPNLYRNFGVFQKFLEIAGDIKIPLRDGTLYNEQDKPATIEDLCFMLDLPKQTLLSALQALIKAGWMLGPRISQNLPKNPGNSGTLQELNSTQLNSTQDKDSSRRCFKNATVNEKETKQHSTTSSGQIVSAWQKLPLPLEKKTFGAADLLAIERVLSVLKDDPIEPLHEGMILEAIENYSKALSLPSSQTYKHKLYSWLFNGHVRKYTSYAFDIDHHDSSKFKKAGQTESAYDQLKQIRKESGK